MNTATKTKNKKQSEPIIVSRSHDSLKNHPEHILKAWVNRFVENGDKVSIVIENNEVVFDCPSFLTELHVMMLCDIIEEFGFAKEIFRFDS